MIVNTTCTITHTTTADANAWYSVPFTYVTVLNVPQLVVTLNDASLTYGTDYTLGTSGLKLLTGQGAGKTLVITRNTPATQTIDFQTGMVDPDEIERSFDLAAMRDQELKNKVDNFTASTNLNATLLANGWTNRVQTVTVSGVTTTNTVIISPAPASVDDYLAAGIVCTAQGSNSLTFKCETLPSHNITLNIAILK